MSIKKRSPSYDIYDFACLLAEGIDFVHYILYSLRKDRFRPFRILKFIKKEAPYKFFYRRINCLSAWNKWAGS